MFAGHGESSGVKASDGTIILPDMVSPIVHRLALALFNCCEMTEENYWFGSVVSKYGTVYASCDSVQDKTGDGKMPTVPNPKLKNATTPFQPFVPDGW